MPELPEVETVVRTLRPRLIDQRIQDVWTSGLRLRAPLDRHTLAAACVGATVQTIERRAKYILIALSSGQTLLIHLGMSGRLLVCPVGTAVPPHLHARFHLTATDLELRYVDPRRFGSIVPYPHDQLDRVPELAHLGPDPLSAEFTLASFTAALRLSRRDIKQYLLDQTLIAGLGNIYVCEALFRARISPARRAHQLGARRAARLHIAIRDVLAQALAHRGTTFRDYVDGGGEPGGNQLRLDVYGRQAQPCHACGTPITRQVQGARSTFFCPRCQR